MIYSFIQLPGAKKGFKNPVGCIVFQAQGFLEGPTSKDIL